MRQSASVVRHARLAVNQLFETWTSTHFSRIYVRPEESRTESGIFCGFAFRTVTLHPLLASPQARKKTDNKMAVEFIKKLFDLVGELDEAGEGYKPSPLSLMLAVDSKTDFVAVDFEKKYSGKKKVHGRAIHENGEWQEISSGNHPVEVVQPIMHLINVVFEFDVATPTGKSACIEMWALPTKDEAFLKFFNEVAKPKLDEPLSLEDIVASPTSLEIATSVLSYPVDMERCSVSPKTPVWQNSFPFSSKKIDTS